MTIAFVSAPGGSTFMAEILAAVADAVRATGAAAMEHTGTIDELADMPTAFVVVPHEYFALSPRPSAGALARTIAFGVEHPGTATFERSAAMSRDVAARFELSSVSVAALASRGEHAEHFPLGYCAAWDHWGGAPVERPIDVACMATVDEGRLRVLARIAPDLAGLSTELFLPPHEQMTQPRPDFLVGEDKWRLLARSKVLLNLHRQQKTALEWVRTLEAMSNGCVLLTEPSTELGRLVPGRHLLIASRDRIGAVARAAVDEPERLAEIAAAAYALCKDELDMSPQAARLAEVAGALAGAPRPTGSVPEVANGTAPPASTEEAWLPELSAFPAHTPGASAPAHAHTADASPTECMTWVVGEAAGAEVDVVVAAHPGAGPAGLTAGSLARQRLPLGIHLATVGTVCAADLPCLVTCCGCPEGTSLGAARNAALARGSAEYVLVLEAGDELFPGALAAMLAALRSDPDAEIAYPLAAHGSEGLMNVFPPAQWRLDRHEYLTRGYLVRRRWFAEHGYFPEERALEALIDHDFWLRSTWSARAIQLRSIGVRLWPTDRARLSPPDVSLMRRRLGYP